VRPYEYTWMWTARERDVRLFEFFLDAVRSARKHVLGWANDAALAWAGVCAGPRMCAGVLPGADIEYAMDLLDLSPPDVTLQRSPPLEVQPLVAESPAQTCGFRSARMRPVIAGADIGSLAPDGRPVARGCTAGLIAERGGELGVVTNNHCTLYTACARNGIHAVQPGLACGGTADDRIGDAAACPDYGDGAWPADAAWIRLEVPAEVAVLGEGGAVLRPAGMPRDPVPGELVRKFGRGAYTYSERWGSVVALGVVAGVRTHCGRTLRFEDQVLTTYMLSPGDSGSGLYSAALEPLGLCLAGNDTYSLASRAVTVERELGARILTALPAAPPPPPLVVAAPAPPLSGALAAAAIASLGMAAAGAALGRRK
jgi:hypothetical protein